MKPAFDAWYAGFMRRPRSPATLEIPTMVPLRSVRNRRAASAPRHPAEQVHLNHATVLAVVVLLGADERHDPGDVDQGVEASKGRHDALEGSGTSPAAVTSWVNG